MTFHRMPGYRDRPDIGFSIQGVGSKLAWSRSLRLARALPVPIEVRLEWRDNKTLFIDATAEFVRSGNKNKLTEANRQRILDAFTCRKDSSHIARLVDNAEIAENGCNISVSYQEGEQES